MQKNHQPDYQFLQEMGALLAARAGQGATVPPAVTHLAEHVTSARRHQHLTRAALAQKMRVTEAEIYALEQGLLSYAELDLSFLSKLAAALGEEIETLLLLLGRPALAQARQMQKVQRTGGQPENFVRSPQAKKYATTSKQRGNQFGYKLWTNALYNGCLNLIDSLRQGRLSSYIRVNYRLYPMAAIFACLFLIGVSTYSISGRLGAQSGRQAHATLSVRPDGLLLSQLQQEIDTPLPQRSSKRYLPPEAMTQPVTTSVSSLSSTIASVVYESHQEAQQCVPQAVGRPAICRV